MALFFIILRTAVINSVKSRTYCSYHKWVYRGDEDQFIICESCGKLPGQQDGSEL